MKQQQPTNSKVHDDPQYKALIAAGWEAVSGEGERKQLESLLGLLNSPEAHEYFREPFVIKLLGLSCAMRGSDIAQAAKAFGVSRQAVSRQAVRARKIFRTATARCAVD